MDEEKFYQFYPELIKRSGLGWVLNESLAAVGSHLKADEFNPNLCDCYIRGKTRDAFVGTEWGRRRFYFSCHHKNDELVAHGSTDSLSFLAGAIHQLLDLKQKATEVQQEFPWLELPKDRQEPLGAAAVVKAAWEGLEKCSRQIHFFAPMHPLIILAREHPQLGLHYPYTSLNSLNFSLCTEYPFDEPCSGIWCEEDRKGGSYYYITDSHSTTNFGDDLHAALDFIVAQLPPACGPARLGTADDNESEDTDTTSHIK